MYALIIPASTPFVLLATVMGLSWWEDHVLPADLAEQDGTLAEVPAGAPLTPASPAQLAELPRAEPALTREAARR